MPTDARTLAERLTAIADLWDELRAELRRGGVIFIFPGDISPDDTATLRAAASALARPDDAAVAWEVCRIWNWDPKKDKSTLEGARALIADVREAERRAAEACAGGRDG